MKESYLIGVDLGTSLIKTAVYDTGGECVGRSERTAPEQRPEPGVCLQSGDEFYRLALEAVREAVGRSGVDARAVAGIGFSGQMGGAIGVDADFEAVTEWSNPFDTRHIPYTAEMLEQAREQILRQSGTNASYFGSKVLWRKNEFPELYRRCEKFVFLGGYVAGKMAGLAAEDAFVDQSYLIMTSLVDIAANQWSDELCGLFDIDREKLPRIVDSTTVIGQLTPGAAEQCGLRSGIPLVAGAGDKPAGYMGAGMVEPGAMIDESATFATLSLCVDRFVPDAKYRTLETFPSPVAGQFFPTTVLMGSGASHKWFKDTFGAEEQQEAAAAGVSPYAVLDRNAAALPPGSEGLLALGTLGGRGCPSDPDIRGLWMGHSWNHKKEHFYRALLESYAYEYGHALKIMRENHPDVVPGEVRVIGGGAASDLFNQIKSDVTGLPYVRLGTCDYALLGDALMAGVGVGVYDDLSEQSQKLATREKAFQPDESNHRRYQNYVRLYADLFDRLRESFVELKDIST